MLPVLLLRALGSKMLELKPQRLGAKVLEPHEFLGCELGTKSGWADGCFSWPSIFLKSKLDFVLLGTSEISLQTQRSGQDEHFRAQFASGVASESPIAGPIPRMI